ncbi:hypothetical protein E8E12_000908 [Didymella heteroderae]|uniref:Uncharacterized protein n=1 Tax=Didymella heteroderae TaxID=1769908 RepID=A0A9P5BUD3_9PLEO|nr:hypothetical protein E8E12_000908 [Didymella heteroderae]
MDPADSKDKNILYGDPAKFVDHARVLRYRSVTYLLELTNFVDQALSSKVQAGGTQRDYTDIKGSSPRRRKKVLLYRKLAACIDILCRHYEVVAMTLGPNNVLRGVSTEELEEQMYMYTNNPETTENDRPEKGTPVKGRCQPILSTASTPLNEIPKSPGLLILQRTTGMKAGSRKGDQFPRTNFMLGDHGDMFLQMLRSTYTAQDDDSIKRSNYFLEIYVHLNCSAKILNRMKKGKMEPRFFFTFLTASSKSLNEKLATIPDSRTKLCKHADGITLNEKERRGMLELFEMLDYVFSKGDRNADLAPLKRWDDALQEDCPIQYDEDGFFTLQHLLVLIFQGAFDSMTALNGIKNKLQKERAKSPWSDTVGNANLSEAGRELDGKAHEATVFMQMLARLKSNDRLREILRRHLEILGQFATHTGDSKPKPGTGTAVLATPTRSDVAAKPTSGGPSTGSSIPTPALNESKTSTPAQEKLAADISDKETADDDADREPEHIYKSDYDHIDAHLGRGEWSAGCMKYLDLSCLHTCALLSLSRGVDQDFDVDVANFVKTAKFEWIRHQQTNVDTACMPLSQVLKTAKKQDDHGKEVTLTPEEIKDVVKPVIEAHNRWRFQDPKLDAWEDDGLFKGNVHCESLEMSYCDLQLTGYDAAVLPENALEHKEEYLRLPSRDIVEKFDSPIEILPVSKRCCPACHAFVLYMQNKYKKEIFYPGNHPLWSATTIPPWMLKEAAEHVMGVAEQKLTERITEILNCEDFLLDNTPVSSGSGAGFTAKRGDKRFRVTNTWGGFDPYPEDKDLKTSIPQSDITLPNALSTPHGIEVSPLEGEGSISIDMDSSPLASRSGNVLVGDLPIRKPAGSLGAILSVPDALDSTDEQRTATLPGEFLKKLHSRDFTGPQEPESKKKHLGE